MIIIAAADLNNGIGFRNDLLYNIPEDKKFFREKTTGKTVIMGRKTYESLPFRPLPDRRNIILTENRSVSYEGAETVHSIDELLSVISDIPEDDVFAAGGSEIYRLLEKYCSKAYITRIYCTKPADRYITDFDSSEFWKCAEMSELKEHNGIFFRFITYKKAPH